MWVCTILTATPARQRLTWLENVFSSPVLGPVKLLNRRMGIGGSFFNRFDGSVDLLDDLDDHYTARTHKRERNWLVERLQAVCARFSVRVTILGGDVHLAALGRFYSHPRLAVPAERDHRYMVNVVSSAITNKPPPAAVANLLARRNKIHHLNPDTDETLLRLFDKDPGGSSKTAARNNVTMPSRNFAILTENSPNNTTNNNSATTTNGTANGKHNPTAAKPATPVRDGRDPVSAGEVGCGTRHRAASFGGGGGGGHGTAADGSLDVCICVEIDQRDGAGRTEAYGLTVPALDYAGPCPPTPPPPPPPLSPAPSPRLARAVTSSPRVGSGGGRGAG